MEPASTRESWDFSRVEAGAKVVSHLRPKQGQTSPILGITFSSFLYLCHILSCSLNHDPSSQCKWNAVQRHYLSIDDKDDRNKRKQGSCFKARPIDFRRPSKSWLPASKGFDCVKAIHFTGRGRMNITGPTWRLLYLPCINQFAEMKGVVLM